MSPLEGDRKTSPPLVALLVRGRQVLPSPGGGLRTYLVHRWQAAGLYLEQSVSLEGKGNATVSRDTLGHLSISIWHRRAQGQRNRGGGGFSHENTDSAHRAKGFVSQQVPAPTWECGRGGHTGSQAFGQREHSLAASTGTRPSCLGTWCGNLGSRTGATN